MWWLGAVFILVSIVGADFDGDLLQLSDEFVSPGNALPNPFLIVNIAKYLFQIICSTVCFNLNISDSNGLSTYLLVLFNYFSACFVYQSA